MIKQPETRDIIDELLEQIDKQELHEITPETVKYLCSRIQKAEQTHKVNGATIERLQTQLRSLQWISIKVLKMLLRITEADSREETFHLKRVLLEQHAISIGMITSSGSSTSHENAQAVEPVCEL